MSAKKEKEKRARANKWTTFFDLKITPQQVSMICDVMNLAMTLNKKAQDDIGEPIFPPAEVVSLMDITRGISEQTDEFMDGVIDEA